MIHPDCECEHCGNEPQSPKPFSRAAEWEVFSVTVLNHVQNYTVPQYGDYPDDQVTGWTVEDCIKNIAKYANRFGKQQRKGQERLDLMKIAHYACLAYNKARE